MKIHFNHHIQTSQTQTRYNKSLQMVQKLAFEQMLKTMLNSQQNINVEKRLYNDILVENIVKKISIR